MQHLSGGRTATSVVRVGATVQRTPGVNAAFVHDVLVDLERGGFTGAPRFLGMDEPGREVLTYISGTVPSELGWFSDDAIISAARLLRALHDVTAESTLRGGAEVVCHGDASPCNTVFRDGMPSALIDFDAAHAGTTLVTPLGFGWTSAMRRSRPRSKKNASASFSTHTATWIRRTPWPPCSTRRLLWRLDQTPQGRSNAGPRSAATGQPRIAPPSRWPSRRRTTASRFIDDNVPPASGLPGVRCRECHWREVPSPSSGGPAVSSETPESTCRAPRHPGACSAPTGPKGDYGLGVRGRPAFLR